MQQKEGLYCNRTEIVFIIVLYFEILHHLYPRVAKTSFWGWTFDIRRLDIFRLD